MMDTDCACMAAQRLGVDRWGCKKHGHFEVTRVPVTALLVRDQNAYALLERVFVRATHPDTGKDGTP